MGQNTSSSKEEPPQATNTQEVSRPPVHSNLQQEILQDLDDTNIISRNDQYVLGSWARSEDFHEVQMSNQQRQGRSIFQYGNTVPDLITVFSQQTTPNRTPFRFVKTGEPTPNGAAQLEGSQTWVDHILEKKKTPFKLYVQDASTDDSSIITMSTNKIQLLGLEKGTNVLITGKKGRQILCIILAEDRMQDEKIKMNKVLRDNLKVEIGDLVHLQKYPKTPELTKVVIGPISDVLEGPSPVIKQTDIKAYFEGKFKPLSKNQIFTLTKEGQLMECKVVECEPYDYGVCTGKTTFSVMRAVRSEEIQSKDIGYDDVGGYREQIALIKEAIDIPLKHPKLFLATGMKLPKGVLLYGPKGCGKKLIARAVANESGKNFVSINALDTISKPLSKARDALNEAFKLTKNHPPSILMIDGIDLFLAEDEDCFQRKIAFKFVSLMEESLKREDTYFIGILHKPELLTSALKTFNYFNRAILIGLPDEKARAEILQIHTKKAKIPQEDLELIAKDTEGFTGLDLEKLCTEASLRCIREKSYIIDFDSLNIDAQIIDSLQVTREHFRLALQDFTTLILNRNLTKEEPKFQDNFVQMTPIKSNRQTPVSSLKRRGDNLQRALEQIEEPVENEPGKKIKLDQAESDSLSH